MALQGYALVVIGIGLASLLYYMFSGSEHPYNNGNSSSGGGGGGGFYSSWETLSNNRQTRRTRQRRRSFNMKDCPICFEEIKSINEITLQCQHKFHKSCIRVWTNCGPTGSQNTCPLCRMQYNNI